MQLNQEKAERTSSVQYQRHSSRQRRPVTQNEIYQDAIRILDKLLSQNIEERQRSASKTIRQNEAKTKILERFAHGQVGGYAAGDQAFNKRAQTVPESVYKPDRHRSEDRKMIILSHPGDKLQAEKGEDVVSSADTEASEHEDDSPRKKKSFFKRARERLRQTFRRDQRLKDEDYNPGEKSDKKSKRQKPHGKAQTEDKKKQDDSRKSSPRKTSSGQSMESGVMKNGVNSSIPSTTESNTSGAPRRKSLLKSVRHSFSRSKKDVMHASKSEEPVSSKTAVSLPGRSSSIADNPHLPFRQPGPPSAPPDAIGKDAASRPPSLSGARTSDARLSQYRLSRYGPVPYMDEGEDFADSGGKSNSNSPNSPEGEAGSSLPPAPPPPATGRPRSPRIAAVVDAHVTADEVIRGADGSIMQGHVEIHRQFSLEVDGNEVPFDKKTEKEKEELYQSIADKLREMADNMPVSASEGEGHRQGAAFDPQAGQNELSELERDLMTVMRTGGDRLSTVMDDPTNTMAEEVKEQMYRQFSSTLRHAIGDEAGWNQLAMFFHITKGAFSAADTTTKVLSRGKEMVMRYFADRFAGWIVQQGGWESMLSESDSELD